MGRRSFMNPFEPGGTAGKYTSGWAESVCAIPSALCKMRALMKRVFSNPLVALIAGLCLRLYFVLKFPASSGDTVLYEQIATNWLKHHIYGMDVGGAIIPVDLRMPGYRRFSPSSTLSRVTPGPTHASG